VCSIHGTGTGSGTQQDCLELTFPVPDNLSDPELPEFLLPNMKPVAGAAAPGGFELELALHTDYAVDRTTRLGTRRGALEGYDPLDQTGPPTLSETIAAFFDHPEWADRAGSYDHDYQPALADGEERTWLLGIYADRQGTDLTPSWSRSLPGVPADIQLFLRGDATGGTWLDMRQTGSALLAADSRTTQTRLEVRAKRCDIKATALLPSYPHPLNPEVWIPFELAEDTEVVPEIHNVLGQRLRWLNLGALPGGRCARSLG
jgi:hypothetical protein